MTKKNLKTGSEEPVSAPGPVVGLLHLPKGDVRVIQDVVSGRLEWRCGSPATENEAAACRVAADPANWSPVDGNRVRWMLREASRMLGGEFTVMSGSEPADAPPGVCY